MILDLEQSFGLACSINYALPISLKIPAEQGFRRSYLELIYPSSLRSLPKDRGSEEQILRDQAKPGTA